MSNIVFTGLPGSGKSSLGKFCASELGMLFIDTDELIIQKEGMSIQEIFDKYGEAYFRAAEKTAAREVSAMRGAIIATGGGMVMDPENVQCLRSSGKLIFIDRPLDHIANDIDAAARPLLSQNLQALHQLAENRRARYLETADVVYRNDQAAESAEQEIVQLVRSLLPSKCYTVIGDPVGHSLSPLIHETIFAMLRVQARYTATRVEKGDLATFLSRAAEIDLQGFNATSPHKEDVLAHLSWIDPEAEKCRSVNTVVIRDGKLYGYNTDMQGLALALKRMGSGYGGRNVAIIGAGGAAVSTALKAAIDGAHKVVIFARRFEAASDICNQIAQEVKDVALRPCRLEEIEKILSETVCDLVINTIPYSMEGGQVVAPYRMDFVAHLPDNAAVFDMIYSPAVTPLMKAAQRIGLQVANGLDMLIYQAILSDELYLQREIDIEAAFALVHKTVTENRKEGLN